MRIILLSIVLAGMSTVTYAACPNCVSWTGLGTTSSWSDTNNWNPSRSPGLTDIAVFPSNSQNSIVEVNQSVSIPALTFQSYSTIILNNANFGLTASGIDIEPGGQGSGMNNQAGTLNFINHATANQASITNSGTLNFDNTANAGSAIINNINILNFNDNADAGSATIGNSGTLNFNDSSLLDQAQVSNSSSLYFYDNSDAGLATGSITNTGTVYFNTTSSGTPTALTAHIINNGGTLNLSGITGSSPALSIGSLSDLSSSSRVILGNTALSLGNNNATDSISGIISGSGSLTKIGTGTLTLNGNNTYTGQTTVAAGVLDVNSNASLGTGAIAVNAAGKLEFINNANAGSAHITNAGTVSFIGTPTASTTSILNNGGTLDLSGVTALNIGSVSDNSSSSQIILGNTSLSLGYNSSNDAISGTITGNGSLNKIGSGTLSLYGANTYSGSTTVNSGTLVVGANASLGQGNITINNGAILNFSNSLSASAWSTPLHATLSQANNNITINAGGAFSGFGVVHSLNSFGVVAPGDTNTIGTITVGKDFTANTGSTYQCKIDGQGHSDLLNVGDVALINGGTVNISLLNAHYQTNTPYTLLTAHTLTGQFDSFIQPIALEGELIYDYNQNKIFYQASNLSQDLAKVVSTPNEVNMGNYLLSLVTIPPDVDNQLVSLNTEKELEDYLDQLTAASYANQMLSLAQIDNWFDSHMRDHMLNRSHSNNQLSPWLVARISEDRVFSREVGGFKNRPDGFAYGVESADSDSLFGVGIAYTRFDGQAFDNGEHTQSKGDFYQAGTYLNYTLGDKGLIAASLDFAILEPMRVDRLIASGSDFSQVQGRYRGKLFSAQAQSSYDLMHSETGVQLKPFLGVHYQHLNRPTFAEQGESGARLAINSSCFDSLRSELGLAAQVNASHGLQPFVQAIWEHEFSDIKAGFDASFEGAGGSFHVDSVTLAREACVAKAGLAMNPEANWGLSALYEGRFAKHLQENAAKLQLTYNFL